jgi:hypothetical protein
LFSNNGKLHALRLKNRQTTAVFFPVLTKQHGEKHPRVELGLHVFVIRVVEDTFGRPIGEGAVDLAQKDKDSLSQSEDNDDGDSSKEVEGFYQQYLKFLGSKKE